MTTTLKLLKLRRSHHTHQHLHTVGSVLYDIYVKRRQTKRDKKPITRYLRRLSFVERNESKNLIKKTYLFILLTFFLCLNSCPSLFIFRYPSSKSKILLFLLLCLGNSKYYLFLRNGVTDSKSDLMWRLEMTHHRTREDTQIQRSNFYSSKFT